MHDAVQLLMTKAEDIKQRAEDRKAREQKALDEAYSGLMSEARNLIKAAQAICPHDGAKRTEDFEDYHKGTIDHTEYCEICQAVTRHY